MRNADKTMREIFEMIGGSHPIQRAINDMAFERLQNMGILDTKKKDVGAFRRYKFVAGLAKDTLSLIGMIPGGQIIVFLGMSFIFLPIYFYISRH